MPKTRFTVTYKSGDVEPIEAEGYVIDGEALVFLSAGREIAALFDINFVQQWEPRGSHYELPLSTET